MIGHIERFNPAVIELKKRLKDVGRIIKIEAKRVGPYPSRIQDVGVIIDLTVHDIDIMSYLLDDEVSTVTATKKRKINSKNEDMVIGILHFHKGVVGVLDTNWLTPTKIRKLTVLGEKGMFVVNYLTQDLYFYENQSISDDFEYADIMRGVTEGRMIKYPVNKKEPLQAEIEHFIDCVKNDKTVLVSAKEGLKVLETALQMVD